MKVYRIWDAEKKRYWQSSSRNYWPTYAGVKSTLAQLRNTSWVKRNNLVYVIHEFELSEPKEII